MVLVLCPCCGGCGLNIDWGAIAPVDCGGCLGKGKVTPERKAELDAYAEKIRKENEAAFR